MLVRVLRPYILKRIQVLLSELEGVGGYGMFEILLKLDEILEIS